jgi:hypothetical protein
MTCEGSNCQPVIGTPTGIGDYHEVRFPEGTVDVAGKPVPYTYVTGHSAGQGVCPHCQVPKRLLKSGALPKHSRYVSWKERQENPEIDRAVQGFYNRR